MSGALQHCTRMIKMCAKIFDNCSLHHRPSSQVFKNVLLAGKYPEKLASLPNG